MRFLVEVLHVALVVVPYSCYWCFSDHAVVVGAVAVVAAVLLVSVPSAFCSYRRCCPLNW